eukprot:GABV01003621.1.p1 GENE.GABV01003621.1~~GABV01003621.1.p1  ORF type:complete len:141 (+),score=29.28 GABV01003621.1:110-532(+)
MCSIDGRGPRWRSRRGCQRWSEFDRIFRWSKKNFGSKKDTQNKNIALMTVRKKVSERPDGSISLQGTFALNQAWRRLLGRDSQTLNDDLSCLQHHCTWLTEESWRALLAKEFSLLEQHKPLNTSLFVHIVRGDGTTVPCI